MRNKKDEKQAKGKNIRRRKRGRANAIKKILCNSRTIPVSYLDIFVPSHEVISM